MSNILKDMFVPFVRRKDLINVDFLRKSRDIKPHKRRLEHAMKLGNTGKQKVGIIFESRNGILRTNTTIWMVGTEYVLVKGNIAIPIDSILEIRI